MRIYKEKDIRAYPFVFEFITNNKSLINYYYDSSKETYFKNVLNDCIWHYKIIMQKEYDLISIKYYEGIIKQFYYYIYSLNLIPGIDITTNQVFNYELIIKRCNNQLSTFLRNAQIQFESGINYLGSFYIGQFYGNKEIIKICKKFKNN